MNVALLFLLTSLLVCLSEKEHGSLNQPDETHTWRTSLPDFALYPQESYHQLAQAVTDSLNEESEDTGSSSGYPMNRYRVSITAMITPEDEKISYNMLSFSRTYTLEGESFTDIAKQVDFIYDKIQKASE